MSQHVKQQFIWNVQDGTFSFRAPVILALSSCLLFFSGMARAQDTTNFQGNVYSALPEDSTASTPRRLLADKGYDSDRIRENLPFRGILPVIPPRSNRTEDIACDFRCYRNRNRIERMFNKLKQFRHPL